MPLRVLLFVNNLDQGGTEAQLVKLANALEEHPQVQVHLGYHAAGVLEGDLRVPPSRRYAYPFTRYYSRGALRAIRRLRADIARLDIELVHAQDFYANLTCSAACLGIERPRLIVGRRYERRTERKAHVLGEWVAYRVADAVVCNSSSIAASIEARGLAPAGRTTVIPNAVDLAAFDTLSTPSPAVSAVGGRIGIVARLHPVKQHEMLLRAFALVRERRPRAELVVIGDGTERTRLVRLSDDLGVRDAVRFLGEQRDVAACLAQLDVGVLCSRYEGFPNALLEYLAAGVPAAATAVGGVPDLARHEVEALLVAPDDAQGLADALHRLLADPALRSRLSSAGRQRARTFTVDAMVESTLRLYAHVLAAKGRPAPWRTSRTVLPTMERV